MITVATVYYEGGMAVPSWAHNYSPEWVDKLYRGIARYYSRPFRFICLTDREYEFEQDIKQQPLTNTHWQQACLLMHSIETDDVLVTMGIDTVIVGVLDDLFSYDGTPILLPRDPYNPTTPCNGVTIGRTDKRLAGMIHDLQTDLSAYRYVSHRFFDDLYPGEVLSYKVHVRDVGLSPKAKIVYFHGEPKPNQLGDEWVLQNWA